MTWVLVIGLVVGAFLIAVFVLRAPRVSWEAIGAALVLGIAGYALQGSPSCLQRRRHRKSASTRIRRHWWPNGPR